MLTSASILRRVWASLFSLSLSAAVCLSGGVETSSPHLRTEIKQQVFLEIICISANLRLNVSLSCILFTLFHLKVYISNFLQKRNFHLSSQTVSWCILGWQRGGARRLCYGFRIADTTFDLTAAVKCLPWEVISSCCSSSSVHSGQFLRTIS